MFPKRTGLRADRNQTGVPGNSTELLMSSLSESAKPRPVNAVLPLLRQLSALSPTDHHIIRPALPAARTPFSGQVTKRPLLNGPTKSSRKNSDSPVYRKIKN